MFYLFLFAHLVADFVLQPFWLVQRKRFWSGLLLHVAIVLACMLALPLADTQTLRLWPAMLVIAAVHLAADRWKVQAGHRIPGPPIVPFLLDQLIHVTTLAVVLSVALPAQHVWLLSASPVALPLLYASAFVVAACAVPIGAMIWLDPRFSQQALAGHARLRALLAASTVLLLTIFAGVLALPATLLGVAFVVRRPASNHPLDAAPGLLTVICLAAMLGVALALVR